MLVRVWFIFHLVSVVVHYYYRRYVESNYWESHLFFYSKFHSPLDRENSTGPIWYLFWLWEEYKLEIFLA